MDDASAARTPSNEPDPSTEAGSPRDVIVGDSELPVVQAAPSRHPLVEIAILFFRIGATSFGGPPAQVALLEEEVVRRRKWLDRQHFLDLYSAMNVIPGPNSTELALSLGLVRAGFPGLVVAGIFFILPAVLIILVLAWAYTRYGAIPEVRPVMLAVNAAVIAILAAMFVRLTREAVRDALTLLIAIFAVVASVVLSTRAKYQPELIILGTSALVGAVWYGRPRISASALSLLAFAPPPELLDAPRHASMLRLFLAFLKIGATLYGSGYVLVSYLRTTVVEQHGWISERELLDGIAVGQITPGPVLTTATFIGYLIGQRSLGNVPGGIVGALVATAGIFLPSFVLVSVLGHVVQRIRNNRYVRGALDGMNAAVAALILVVTVQLAAATLGTPTLGGPTFGLDPILVGVTVLSAVMLLWLDLNPTWIVLAAGLVGGARVLLRV
jgi:chromate transporter